MSNDTPQRFPEGTDVRVLPCTKRTWCLLDEGHSGGCVEKPRAAIPREDFGPEASKKRRW
jgi:hypothetical protein